MRAERSVRVATYSSAARQVLDNLHDRPVAYHPRLAEILGGTDEALFVSQLLFWDGKGSTPGRWIYKTQPEWMRETGLSRYKQLRVRRHLCALGVLQERRRGIPARLYYRLDLQALHALIDSRSLPDDGAAEPAQCVEVSPTCVGQDREQDGDTVPVPDGEAVSQPAGADATGQSPRSPPAITENTAQITTRETADPAFHDPAEVWHKALPELAGSMERRSYDCWIRPCVLVSIVEEGDGVRATVEAPNEYIVDWLAARLDVVVRRVLSGVLGCPVTVSYALPGDAALAEG
jgi:hypothetical protein